MLEPPVEECLALVHAHDHEDLAGVARDQLMRAAIQPSCSAAAIAVVEQIEVTRRMTGRGGKDRRAGPVGPVVDDVQEQLPDRGHRRRSRAGTSSTSSSRSHRLLLFPIDRRSAIDGSGSRSGRGVCDEPDR
jgi:hypothetical protein